MLVKISTPFLLVTVLSWAFLSYLRDRGLEQMRTAEREILTIWTLWARAQAETGAPRERLEPEAIRSRRIDGSAVWKSAAALADMLAPEFAERLPHEDPWGGEYEWLLTNEGLAVRSAGRDGWFTRARYHFGQFSYQDAERDLVLYGGSWFQGPAYPTGGDWLEDPIRKRARDRYKTWQYEASPTDEGSP